jgi:pSer/pThr/pTyr-binding forkhead associated (FHA) protein
VDVHKRFLLVAPPLPPLRLKAGRVFVLGRGLSCDLTLASPAASRRHAELFGREDVWAVRDLGSTNGTFVNDEAVRGERELVPGDEIRIGEQTLHFCHLEAVPDANESGEERTMILAPEQSRPALRGDLAEIPPIGLLQMLELEQKTGVLEVETEAGKARLWMDAGRPIHAESGEQQGLEAALEIAALRSGRFVLAGDPTPPRRSMELPMMEVVLEASRRMDEAG